MPDQGRADSARRLRPLLPASATQPSPTEPTVSSKRKGSLTVVACETCRKRKQKVIENAPIPDSDFNVVNSASANARHVVNVLKDAFSAYIAGKKGRQPSKR
jgi:hypothetical protein